MKRFTFVPGAAYAKELEANADPNEVPDPPCAEWGDAPVLFVRIGQDEPLFDAQAPRLLPGR